MILRWLLRTSGPNPHTYKYDEPARLLLCYLTWQRDFAEVVEVTSQLTELIKTEVIDMGLNYSHKPLKVEKFVW